VTTVECDQPAVTILTSWDLPRQAFDLCQYVMMPFVFRPPFPGPPRRVSHGASSPCHQMMSSVGPLPMQTCRKLFTTGNSGIWLTGLGPVSAQQATDGKTTDEQVKYTALLDDITIVTTIYLVMIGGFLFPVGNSPLLIPLPFQICGALDCAYGVRPDCLYSSQIINFNNGLSGSNVFSPLLSLCCAKYSNSFLS
jgi:hypothetical protein